MDFDLSEKSENAREKMLVMPLMSAKSTVFNYMCSFTVVLSKIVDG
jgi:hypothetical protein